MIIIDKNYIILDKLMKYIKTLIIAHYTNDAQP